MFEFEEDIINAGRNAGVELSGEQVESISKHLNYVLTINKTLNLTAITDPKQAILLHVEDSLYACSAVLATPEGKYLDMGSGGGYPGVPVAVATERPVLLLDSSKKKMAALDSFITEAKLSSLVETSSLRAEELALAQPCAFSCITARALSSLPSLLELAQPLLCPGGHLICLKGSPSPDELISAEIVADMLGFSATESLSYTLSDGLTGRSIYVYKKSGESQIELPRRVGQAQKRPLA